MHTQLAVQPLLSGLEHQRQRHQVGNIQVGQSLNSLGGILTGRTTNKGKPGQRHHGVNKSLAAAQRVVEELLDRAAEVQTTSKHGYHLGTTRLQLSNYT